MPTANARLPDFRIARMPCYDVVDDHGGVGEAHSDEECIREFCAVGCSSWGAALRLRKFGSMFGSIVTLDKASGAIGKVGIEIYLIPNSDCKPKPSRRPH
jgi:hypothetical protein